MELEGIISRHDPEGVLDRTLVRAIVAEALQQQAAAGLQDVATAALPMEPHAEPTWSGFFKRSIPERQQQVATLWPDVDPAILNSGGLSVDNADSMVENCIGYAYALHPTALLAMFSSVPLISSCVSVLVGAVSYRCRWVWVSTS